MDVSEAVYSRQSTRAFTDQKVSDELIKEIDILAAENVKRSNIFVRLFTSLNYLVWGDV